MKNIKGILILIGIISIVLIVNLSARTKKNLKSLKVGEPAPAFTLLDTEGQSHNLADFKGKYVVLEWVNLGCPYVVKHYDTKNMQGLQAEMKKKGVVWLSICSSAEGKQGHFTPAEWKEKYDENQMASSAVLLDYDGKVGRTYGAKTTPHMFIIDPEGSLVYQGAIDDKPTHYKEDVKGAKNYVRTAITESLEGKGITTASTKSYGCSVKY